MVPWSLSAHSTLLSFSFLVKWFFEQQSQTRGAVQRMRHAAAPPPLARLCGKHLKTSQSPACCLLYQRVSGNLSESSLRYSSRPSRASMQITSTHWQSFCCYLLWYSTSSSFRDLREARPESIPGSWKCHIGMDCSQPSHRLWVLAYDSSLKPDCCPISRSNNVFQNMPVYIHSLSCVILQAFNTFQGDKSSSIARRDCNCWNLMSIYKRMPSPLY